MNNVINFNRGYEIRNKKLSKETDEQGNTNPFNQSVDNIPTIEFIKGTIISVNDTAIIEDEYGEILYEGKVDQPYMYLYNLHYSYSDDLPFSKQISNDR